MKAIDDIHGDVVIGNQFTSYKMLSFFPDEDFYFLSSYLLDYFYHDSLPY